MNSLYNLWRLILDKIRRFLLVFKREKFCLQLFLFVLYIYRNEKN